MVSLEPCEVEEVPYATEDLPPLRARARSSRFCDETLDWRPENIGICPSLLSDGAFRFFERTVRLEAGSNLSGS